MPCILCVHSCQLLRSESLGMTLQLMPSDYDAKAHFGSLSVVRHRAADAQLKPPRRSLLGLDRALATASSQESGPVMW